MRTLDEGRYDGLIIEEGGGEDEVDDDDDGGGVSIVKKSYQRGRMTRDQSLFFAPSFRFVRFSSLKLMVIMTQSKRR